MAAALQNRSDGLWAQFTAIDDPVQRGIVERQRLEALGALEETRAERNRLDGELREIEDEARRAGVPPGWLREDRIALPGGPPGFVTRATTARRAARPLPTSSSGGRPAYGAPPGLGSRRSHRHGPATRPGVCAAERAMQRVVQLQTPNAPVRARYRFPEYSSICCVKSRG